MKDLTWYYLRESYYPQFKEGVTKMPWDERFSVLRELYDAKEELPWEIRTEDPVADMMNWVAKKGDEAHSFATESMSIMMGHSNYTGISVYPWEETA